MGMLLLLALVLRHVLLPAFVACLTTVVYIMCLQD
jgi:hypothetical protein